MKERCRKGRLDEGMVRDFYPFVEKQQRERQEGGESPVGLEVHHPARIAVYDDAAAAPRVVLIEPQEVRPYLEEITQTVARLAKEQGGSIPFMVIREIVENFIHAYFIQPTISILDDGNTIRFSDQGPGIREKPRALEYGTSSATEEMRQFIRGVGSGLPYVQQYMSDKGGSLTIEDNMSGGTVVTISTFAKEEDGDTGETPFSQVPQAVPAMQYPTYAWPGYTNVHGYITPAPPVPQQMPGMTYQPRRPQAQPVAMAPQAGMHISERGLKILQYLRDHESVGPSALQRIYGASQPTWSRELAILDELGLVVKRKGEQKRHLSAAGEVYVQSFS